MPACQGQLRRLIELDVSLVRKQRTVAAVAVARSA
jgi:hypothetical protein